MNRVILNVIIAILIISLFGCVTKNKVNDDKKPSNSDSPQSGIHTDYNTNQNEANLSNDLSQNDVNPSDDVTQNTTPSDDEGVLNINDYKILDDINTSTIKMAKYILSADIDLEKMEKEYGEIVEVDWIDGALYRHENLNLWVAYYAVGIEGDFVVGFTEDAYIISKLGEVEIYNIDYTKGGPYTILDEAKNAQILYVKCQLSDLFNTPVDMTIEDFMPFAKIYDSLEWDAKDIAFNYNELTIRIYSSTDDMLNNDCNVFISLMQSENFQK